MTVSVTIAENHDVCAKNECSHVMTCVFSSYVTAAGILVEIHQSQHKHLRKNLTASSNSYVFTLKRQTPHIYVFSDVHEEIVRVADMEVAED